MVNSVSKSLRRLDKVKRSALIKLSVLLPGAFDKETLTYLLDMDPTIAEKFLKTLTVQKLLQQDACIRNGYKVTPIVREASM